MVKFIIRLFLVSFLILIGIFGYFFFAGEIKNTLQFDEDRFVSIQKFIKQGKIESLQQAKLQLNVISSDFKQDSVVILTNQLNETAMVQAKVCLSKEWYGACKEYLNLVSADYKPNEVAGIRSKLDKALIEKNVTKTKTYLKERNLDKSKVYFAKIDSTYNKKKRQQLEDKIYLLENELKLEEVENLIDQKEFDDARDKIAEVDEKFNRKMVAELSEQINQKEKIVNLLDDDGSIIAFVDEFKTSMNDPASFEHIETTVFEKGKYLQVSMEYREVNTYGAKVLNKVEAKLNEDGSIKKIIRK
ncbi:hypothetical protein [Flammeovirga sp. SubArs3]|uniref:hypothetical protein n=1 Tax=Flammeovirga sp. SubArs3 TaxID=2995316 RepID=UPI00248AC3CC|nr:hypothetical protein [Flammeovirga sp. SubArs3]